MYPRLEECRDTLLLVIQFGTAATLLSELKSVLDYVCTSSKKTKMWVYMCVHPTSVAKSCSYKHTLGAVEQQGRKVSRKVEHCSFTTNNERTHIFFSIPNQSVHGQSSSSAISFSVSIFIVCYAVCRTYSFLLITRGALCLAPDIYNYIFDTPIPNFPTMNFVWSFGNSPVNISDVRRNRCRLLTGN